MLVSMLAHFCSVPHSCLFLLHAPPPALPRPSCRAAAEKGWNGVPYIQADGSLSFEHQGTTYFYDYDDQ
jgi:hypothetical protein